MTSTLPNFAAVSSPPAAGLPADLLALTSVTPGGTAPAADFADLFPGAAAPAAPTSDPAGFPAALLLGITQRPLVAAAAVARPGTIARATDARTGTGASLSREQLEQAAALVSALFAALQGGQASTSPETGTAIAAGGPGPGTLAPTEDFPAATPVVNTCTLSGNDAPVASASSYQANLLAPVTEGIATPQVASVEATVNPEAALSLSARANAAVPTVTPPGAAGSATPTRQAAIPAVDPALLNSFTAALADDGAIEVAFDGPAPAAASDAAGNSTTLPFAVAAEIELPGQAVVRLTASGVVNLTARTAGEFVREAIFAGDNPGNSAGGSPHAMSAERNFVSTGDKRVKTRTPADGIAVAKSGASMPTAPTEELRAARPIDFTSNGSMRGDFQVAQPPAERITVAATAPAGQTLAERAVATVTSLVEAQFSASMQKAGSVQLRLKFGGEDLSVRVEMRGGVVHTDFRTDSADLRAALTREWQAVAAESPEQMARYVAPVFSPAASATGTSSGSGDSSFAARQQQAAQQDLPQRAPREVAPDAFPFNRRSQLSESFAPHPVEPRTAAFLPTSLRLSALA